MKKPYLLLFILCFFFIEHTVVRGQEENRKAHLFDSYGNEGSEDARARLDNFALELQNKPDVDAYVICYGPRGDGSGTGNGLIETTKNYFVNVRGIEAERIQTVNAGRYKNPAEIETELWIVPRGAKLPEPKRYKSKLKKVAGKFIEYKGWDGIADGGDGPSLGNVTLAAFADSLRQQPNDLAYIVAYNIRGATPGTWRRVAKRDVADLQGYGIQADRIKVIYGGTTKKDEDEDAQQALVQLWILSSDAPPPVKEAKPEATPEKAIQIGTYNDYLLKYSEQERSTFNGFADVLRANEQLNVYIVTRPRIEQLEQSVLPDDPPDIDPVKLADKWKTELMEKSGIKENRIIIINSTADENRQGEVEVWVAPPGASLPDPNASTDEVTDSGTPKEL